MNESGAWGMGEHGPQPPDAMEREEGERGDERKKKAKGILVQKF